MRTLAMPEATERDLVHGDMMEGRKWTGNFISFANEAACFM